MSKSKARSLDEDKQILRKKIHEKKSESENPQDCHTVRALRKRLKRIQRKVRCVNAREAKANPKKQVDAKA